MTSAKRPSGTKDTAQAAPLPDSAFHTAMLLDATFDALTDALVVVDVTGRIVRANAAFRRIVGSAADDDFIDASQAEQMQRVTITDANGHALPTAQWPLTRVLRGEHLDSATERDIHIHTRDGQQTRLSPSGNPLRDVQGQIIGGVIVYHDVTAQRQAESAREAALAEAEAERQHLAALLDLLPAGVAIYDAQGHLVQQNSMADRLTGRAPQPDELANERQTRYGMRRPDGTAMPEPETPSGRARRGQTFANLTCVIAGPDGHDITLLTSGTPLPDAQGKQRGALVAFQDVTALRSLEAEAKAQRDLAEGMLAATPFGVVLFDVSAEFRCLRHNTPFLTLLGSVFRARDTIVGEPLDALVDMATATQIRAIFTQVRDTATTIVIEEFPAITPPEAEVRWYKFSVSPLLDSMGKVSALLGSAIEISEQVRAREMQRQETARLQAVLDVLPTGVAIADAHMHIIQVNPALEELWGEPTAHSIATNDIGFARCWWPDGRQLIPTDLPMAQAIATNTPILNQEIDIHAYDDTRRTVLTSAVPIHDSQGAVVGGVSATRDITERRFLEQRTHTSLDALLRMAQTSVGAGGDLRVAAHELAQVTCEVLGCQRVGVTAIAPDTGILRPLAVVGLTKEEEVQWWATQPTDARYGEGGNPEQVARFAAGEEMIIDMTVSPFDQQPNPFGITTALIMPMRFDNHLVGILSLDHAGIRHNYAHTEIDLARGVADLAALVIERERLQAANTAAQAQALALAATNERMHTFLGIAGHELRTPITSIKASVQLATRATQQAQAIELPEVLATRLDRATRLLLSVNSQADKLNRFITDLLDVTRIRSGTMEMRISRCDLANVVREGTEAVQLEWPKRIIHVDVPTAPLWVNGDADRLWQVVTNLMTNALKYSAPEQPIHVRLYERDGHAQLEVIDHGPGLTEAQQAQIFQAFGRIEDIQPQSGANVGLGLGLFICQTIITRHGGHLGVTSQPGQGSTFWCMLPLAAAE